MGRKPKPKAEKGLVYRAGAYHFRYYTADHKQVSEKVVRGDKDDPAVIEKANLARLLKLGALVRDGATQPRQDYTVEQVWEIFIAQGGRCGKPFKPKTRYDYELKRPGFDGGSVSRIT